MYRRSQVTPVHESHAHLPDLTLDLLAEGELSHADRTAAEAHLHGCAVCRSELDAARAVIAALASLPRFEPSPAFADAVMARVVPLPQQAVAEAGARRWLPRTRRGWVMMGALSAAPLASLLALLAWLLSHPMVTPGALWGIGQQWVRDTAWAGLARVAEALVLSGTWQWVADAAGTVASLTATQTSAALLAVAIAIPASAWVMSRLLRTPMGGITHAH
jgi:hypothetical protein